MLFYKICVFLKANSLAFLHYIYAMGMVSKLFMQSVNCLKTVTFDKNAEAFDVLMREKMSKIGIFEKTPLHSSSVINTNDEKQTCIIHKKDESLTTSIETQTDENTAEPNRFDMLVNIATNDSVVSNIRTRGAPKKH